MKESQLDAYNEGAVEKAAEEDVAKAVDEAIERRDYVLYRIEAARRVLDWIERHTPELCACGVRERFPRLGEPFSIVLYHVTHDGVTFIANGPDQTQAFVDTLAFMAQFDASIQTTESVDQTIVKATIADRQKATFIFTTSSISQHALDSAEGKDN